MRLWIEAFLASITAQHTVLTAIVPTWSEAVLTSTRDSCARPPAGGRITAGVARDMQR
jgi:hypothetical protein